MSACCFMFLDDKSVVTSYLQVFMTGLNIKCAIIQGALVLASLLSYKKLECYWLLWNDNLIGIAEIEAQLYL